MTDRKWCCAAYMSSPCHIELILSEKPSAVPAGVVSTQSCLICFETFALCLPVVTCPAVVASVRQPQGACSRFDDDVLFQPSECLNGLS